MQDLTQLGLLGAPHISAGRIPTHAGLRLFVDGILEVGDLIESERRDIDARLSARGQNFEEALSAASEMLSGLAGGASMVVTPVRDAGVKHVEFVTLGADQALAIMVFEDGSVENRLMFAGRPGPCADRGDQLPQFPAQGPHPGRGRQRDAR